ncbi:uncharacterized protein LOC110177875 [Drosophila serrata]|uniref:uncharacterized protein LOC110177875 n=1 Tax=Drosophila serrata TaxID=7274 RepID=UPI000A1D212F|nr:uncharacterized protein LOC110177875 [Drosophila serrata]
MFQKRIIELITVLVYWMLLTPYIYKFCKDRDIVKFSADHLISSMGDHCTFALCLMIGYVVFYRVVIFIYMKFKVCDIRMWDDLKHAKDDPEAHFGKKSHYKPVSLENVDVVDSPPGKLRKTKSMDSMKKKGIKHSASPPPMIRTISNPLLIESDLARIHIKHETRPLESATLPRHQQLAQVHPSPNPSLRSAPPVPLIAKSATLPNNYGHGVIMSPKVLMPRPEEV